MADKWPDCSKDRADLLLHVEALEQGFERLRNTASHYWCKRFWEERDRVYALEQEVERLRELPEHIELDLMNAGAVGLAKQLLSDDGRGEMSPGPCADALALIRKLKTAERKLARLVELLSAERKALKDVERFGGYGFDEVYLDAKRDTDYMLESLTNTANGDGK